MSNSRVFQAIADPTRRRILRILAQSDANAGDIASQFAMTAPTVSHHLNVLKQADLVASRRVGQQIIYSLNTTVFQELLASIVEIVQPGVKDGEQP